MVLWATMVCPISFLDGFSILPFSRLSIIALPPCLFSNLGMIPYLAIFPNGFGIRNCFTMLVSRQAFSTMRWGVCQLRTQDDQRDCNNEFSTSDDLAAQPF